MAGENADPVREYSESEKRRLAENLREVVRSVFAGHEASEPCLPSLVAGWHAKLFAGVRDHAGRFRCAEFGQEHLRFGPNRSVHRNAVESELTDLFDEIRKAIASFDEDHANAQYEPDAVRVAVWAHAELVRIHPFEDGSGRTGRLLLNWILVRLRLPPFVIEAPRGEYFECLNHYYRMKDIRPLVDLYLASYLRRIGQAGHP